MAAWTTPATITPGQLMTDAVWNAQVRDNLNAIVNPPYCDLVASVVTYTTAVQAAQTWASANANTDTNWVIGNPTRITFNTAGLYLVEGTIAWTANGTGTRSTQFRKNLTTVVGPTSSLQANGVGSHSSPTSFFARFAVADYLEMMGNQTSGGPLASVVSGSTYQIRWMGP